MEVNNKYFAIVIDNNSFYIVESSSQPKIPNSAFTTLAKIETIVKNQLEYKLGYHDEYSNLSYLDLWEILKKKSSDILDGYKDKEKQAKLNWLARKFFSQEKKLDAMHTRIENYVIPPQVLLLPNELIQKVAKHLGIFDLGVLAQLNRHGKAHGATAILHHARKFGYEGYNHTEATEYIKNLINEIRNLASQGIIPKKHLNYKEKKLDLKGTLQNLQSLTTEDIFNILASKNCIHHLSKNLAKYSMSSGIGEYPM